MVHAFVRAGLELILMSQLLVQCTSFPSAYPQLFRATGLGRLYRKFEKKKVQMTIDGSIASEVRTESSSQKRRFYLPDGDVRIGGEVSEAPTSDLARIFRRPGQFLSSGIEKLQRFLFATFLPVGFPSSVPQEYVRFQLWNVLQDLSSNLRGIMSTQKLLEGMGVGKAGVTSLAATLQWVARDGSAMIGGLIFTAIASSNFGRNVKKWRMFADLVNDVALTIDMFAPAFPRFFLPLICFSSILKAMCGISAGACNNAIMQHWALRGNIADVGAKSGAQHTLVSLCALPLGMAFASWVNASASLLWPSFILLTVLHIYANWFYFGVSLSALVAEGKNLPELVKSFQAEKFMLADLSSGSAARPRMACVVAEGATAEDLLRAYLTAHLLCAATRAEGGSEKGGRGKEEGGGGEWARKVKGALEKMESEIGRVKEELCKAGWDTQSLSLGDAGWVATW